MELEHARQELQQILNSPEYQIYYAERQQSFSKDWLERVQESLNWLWGRNFPEQAGFTSGFSYLSLLILGVTVLLFIIVLVGVFRKMSSGFLWREEMSGGASQTTTTPKAYLKEAERWAGIQNYEQAMRALFACLLVILHEKGWIETKAWKTNGEYFRELQSRPKEATDVFTYLAGSYEETVYGGVPTKPEIYRLCRAEVENYFGKEVTE